MSLVIRPSTIHQPGCNLASESIEVIDVDGGRGIRRGDVDPGVAMRDDIAEADRSAQRGRGRRGDDLMFREPLEGLGGCGRGGPAFVRDQVRCEIAGCPSAAA
ncbi:MAG TPA: hypothetical protein VK601_13680 [Kofleriaceae bacterium]|nr:hypothetical protein [Kofleriaceae bacterium]